MAESSEDDEDMRIENADNGTVGGQTTREKKCPSLLPGKPFTQTSVHFIEVATQTEIYTIQSKPFKQVI